MEMRFTDYYCTECDIRFGIQYKPTLDNILVKCPICARRNKIVILYSPTTNDKPTEVKHDE